MVMKQLLLAFAAAVLWGSVLVSAQANFQFYKLSMMWPDSYCRSLPQQQTCINQIPKYFTIHGFWPTFGNGQDTPVPPYHPTQNRCFNNPVAPATATAPNTLAPILMGLNAKWPNLIVRTQPNPNQAFWQHEWSSHGMCSDYGADPFSYFNIALNLGNDARYNPFTAMGVQPSTTAPYQINTLLANVQRNVGFLPEISCYSDRQSQRLYLKEFRFCFVRAMPPAYLQDCPNQIDRACGSVQSSVWIL